MLAASIVPDYQDWEWIAKRVGVFPIGAADRGDGNLLVRYQELIAGQNDEFTRIIENYDHIYLEVDLPKKMTELSSIRDNKIGMFKFLGMSFPLDEITKMNLSGAVVGLQRNVSVNNINWSLGGGEFIQLPRQTLFSLADAAFLHVQKCFDNHKLLADACKAATNIYDLRNIDLTVGWPE